MKRLYTSLMLDTLYKRVESSEEITKSISVGQQLLATLEGIPSFRQMARERLVEKLREYHPGVQLDKVFINRADVDHNLGSRPQGSLLDVYVECLSRFLSPTYIIDADGLYDRPDTTDVRFKVSGLDLIQVERLIDNALQALSREHRTSLEKYWQAPAVRGAFSNKTALQQAISRALMAQLSLSVMGNRLESGQAENLAKALVSETGYSLYKVLINDAGAPSTSLASVFIVDMANLGAPQLSLNDDHYSCFLYTPVRGYEFFVNSNDLHATLCSRLSVAGYGLTYPRLKESVFEFCVESHLKQQADEVARLANSRERDEAGGLVALEQNQRFSTLRQHWLSHFALLRAAVSRGEWPAWLQAAGESVQNNYLQLETSMRKYHEDFQRTHAPTFSLKDYARTTLAEWTKSTLGVSVDGNTVRVHTTYEMKLGGKTIRHEESRSLTELVAFGAHDVGFAPKLTLVGAENTGLTVDKLNRWLQQTDLRKEFVETRSDTPSADYHDALSNKLISEIQFDLLVAFHSRRLEKNEFDLVNQALGGDPSVLMAGVHFAGATQPLKDILIFQGGRRDLGPQLVYMRLVEGGNGFLRFNRFEEFSSKLKEWLSNDSTYATSMLHAKDLPTIGNDLQHAEGLAFDLNRIRAASVEFKRRPDSPLAGVVAVHFGWTAGAAASIAPLNFRAVPQEVRQRHVRLTTELKALYSVELRETGFPSYENFARDLIKTRIEEVLRSRGRYVEVNPDLVFVQISATENWVLTELIVQERAFEPPSSPQWDPSDYPRFHWSTAQPSLDALTIKDIASWSKTLRPGEKYIEMLKTKFQSKAPLYAFKREVHLRRLHAEMSLALVSQYADAQLNNEQFNSLQRLLTELQTPQPIKVSDPVVASESVYEFKIKNTRRVDGVYVFRTMTSQGVADFLYTPDAPDRIAFRKAADFVGSIRLRARSLRNYYIDRVALVDQKVVNDYFDELQATVKDVPAPVPYTNTRIRDLRTAYDAHVSRVIEDIDKRTTSLAEIIGGLIYDNVKLAASVIALVIAPVGLALTAVEVAKSIYDSANAHYYGENGEAFAHFRDALLGLATLGQAGLGAESVTRLQRTLIELAGDADTVVGLLATALGQKLGHERLRELIEQVLDTEAVDSSKTTVS
ncbi:MULTISPECIES: DUF6543 domain-containing protein [unclassified Pseudomonas]|uniref:DUF6543 domain-containing protein n=1 Tax=unclassified Pseudomonas TaxID=196821 RepID=UPI002A36FF31|nr:MULTISPECIES: DUF6543 domain-containing protein [unclassified Pseudomonas]MDX9672885.1 hypothetical protein [Pseudomonas sp. P8_250]WPN38563.1 hypothetical protein QMK53_13195 [Pseudomonas sp. P8_139]WPN39634.1 hypothetical protein QMK55_18180 [Pseudomonas sp. P8_229]